MLWFPGILPFFELLFFHPCFPQVVELTEAGRQFFTAAFERFDVDDDGVLSAREQEEMFSTAPAE